MQLQSPKDIHSTVRNPRNNSHAQRGYVHLRALIALAGKKSGLPNNVNRMCCYVQSQTEAHKPEAYFRVWRYRPVIRAHCAIFRNLRIILQYWVESNITCSIRWKVVAYAKGRSIRRSSFFALCHLDIITSCVKSGTSCAVVHMELAVENAESTIVSASNRQQLSYQQDHRKQHAAFEFCVGVCACKLVISPVYKPVSYTHLTLPTICSV